MSTLRCILNVELYEISEKFIRKLRNANKKPEMIFDILPEYSINENKGANNCLVEAKYYLQFIGGFETTGENYLLVNLSTSDRLLDYEIRESGIVDLFKEIDFKKILSVFTPLTDDAIKKHVISTSKYLVVELTYDYTVDYYGGGWDCDMVIDIIGYLNNKMEIQYYDESIRTKK